MGGHLQFLARVPKIASRRQNVGSLDSGPRGVRAVLNHFYCDPGAESDSARKVSSVYGLLTDVGA